MEKDISDILRSRPTFFHRNRGVGVCITKNKEEGSRLACEILSALVDRQTVLYLSGGTTPDLLYSLLSSDEMFLPGAVGLVDERYGERLHEKSNELMIRDTGLLKYLSLRDVPFYPVLQGKDIAETAEEYDDRVRSLTAVFRRSVAVLGIGADGHTAGIPSRNSKFNPPAGGQNAKLDKYRLVTSFIDPRGKFKERISMTFLGLSMLDFLLVMAFGDSKQKVLEKMFTDGSREDIPARFLTDPAVASKTLFITDQKA